LTPSLSLFAQARKGPWIYFLVFFGVNVVLSTTTLPGALRGGAGLAGLVLFLIAVFRAWESKSSGQKSIYTQEGLFPSPGWMIGGGLALALVLRFYRLETFFSWPTGDEAWNGNEALELSRHWTWKFFHTLGQAPPLPVWTSGVLFKLGLPPGVCLWFPSAVASALTVIAGTFAARLVFSRGFSLLCGALLAFSFWPLFIGRFAHQGIWLPLWVCVCFLLAGRFFKARPGSRGREAALLGLAAGLGSFTFTPWPVVVCVLGAVVFRETLMGRRKNPREFLALAIFFILGLSPFLLAASREGFGEHLLKMGAWNGFSFHHQASILFHYLTALFWGAFDPGSAYVPAGGGFLNPLLGSVFFLGLLVIVSLRKESWVKWFFAAFLVFLLPGLLSHGVETFRVAQVLPLLLFPAALGIGSLLLSLPSAKRIWFLVFFLSVSAVWDLNRLAEPGRDPLLQPERSKAYQVLSTLSREQGPGWILTDLDSANDGTLSVMTHPFNAAGNPALDPGKCRWLAVFVNVHYGPFLQKRFPEGRWFRPGPDRASLNGGGLLVILPITEGNGKALRRWRESHEVFQQADRQWFSQTDEKAGRVLAILERAAPLVQGDPFLESCYWDKRAFYEYQNADYEQHLRCYRMAVSRGYPTADLYYKLGLLFQVKGRFSEAREAFQRATRAPLDLTPARFELGKPPGR
jgi:4-amino-4-deoxy-L-arabinose transferase-like glycosyltransferase